MARTEEIVVTLPGGRRVDAQVGKHKVQTDQPLDNGGQDTAVSPFELFLASLGTCAGIFIQGFCKNREIPYEGIQIIQRLTYGEGGLSGVELEIKLPPGFPEKYKDAVIKVADQCSVKKALANPPKIEVKATLAA